MSPIFSRINPVTKESEKLGIIEDRDPNTGKLKQLIEGTIKGLGRVSVDNSGLSPENNVQRIVLHTGLHAKDAKPTSVNLNALGEGRVRLPGGQLIEIETTEPLSCLFRTKKETGEWLDLGQEGKYFFPNPPRRTK